MDSIKIYSASGALLIDAVLEETSAQDWGIMSENQVALEFYTDECVILPASCYIEFDGQRFWLLEEYKPTENDSEEWAYQVRFLGAESLLAVTVVLNTTDNLDEPIFNLTAPASQHLDFIVKNLNRRFPGMNWRVGVVPETENIHIEYVGTYASDALQTIVGEKYEWWVDDYVVNVGRCEFGTTIELGYGKGLIGGITYSTANEMRSYAYLYPIGSTRNIDPAKYGHARLQLPNGQTRIDINPEQGLSELVEADAFASIFPRYVGKVTSVRTSTGKNSDGTTFLIYHIKDTAIPFNPNDYEIAGEVKHITFQSGELMGADFEVNYDANNKEFEIITQFLDEGLSQLPGGTLIPKTGDKYVVWNISMPDEYYPLAEQEFLQAALSFVQDSIKETSVYRAPVDFIDLQERGLTLRPGQKVRLLSDEYFPQNGYFDSRITRIIRDICYPDELIIEVSTVVTQGTISRLRTSVSDSATKVASLGQSLKNYVDVMSPQSVRGVKNFVNGLSIGGVGLWRHPDGYVYLDETLVLKGGVVMYANGSGVSVPSIFDSLPIDDYTIKRDGNGALYVDETALSISGGGGGGGVADSVHWNNVTGKPSWIGSTKPTYKYSEIEERPDLSVYAKTTDIPSLAGYATQTWVEGKGYLLATTASSTYQPKITSSNKLAYSLISGTPDLSVYALNTDLAKKWTQNDAKIAKWDSAYSWGNHANAGYAKASDVTNEFKNYVKLAGDSQSITAQHNFANGLKIGGISLRKVDNYLYLDSSLVLSGGVTMYGDDGTTVKPIWESIPFDRTTIDWVDGKWTVVGGVGSGGISEEFLNVKLQEYQPLLSTTNKLPYSLISGTPDLSDYATQTWVEDGFVKTLNANSSLPSLFNIAGYGFESKGWKTTGPAFVFGINTYKAGFQSNYSSGSLYFGYAKASGEDLGDWQKIAFSSDIPTKLSQLTDDVVAGKYLPLSGGTINGSITATSFVGTLDGQAAAASLLRKTTSSTSWCVANGNALDIYNSNSTKRFWFGYSLPEGSPYATNEWHFGASDGTGTDSGKVYASSFIGDLTGIASNVAVGLGTSNSYRAIVVTNGNNGLYTAGPATGKPQYNYSTGDVKAKSFTTDGGSFNGDLSGNADSATDASNLTQTTYTGDVNADDLYGSKSCVLKLSTNANLPTGMNYGNILYIGGGDTGFMLAGSYSRDKLLFRRGTNKHNAAQNIHTNSWKEIAFTDSNVASATKLATARTIWGNDFDGSAPISGNIIGKVPTWSIISGEQNIIRIATTGTIITPYDKESGWVAIRTGDESTTNGSKEIRLLSSGNVAIGSTTADAKLHVHGTAKFTGDTTFSSKVIVGTIPVYQSADGTLFVDANVVFRGGVAMYGDTTTTVNEE